MDYINNKGAMPIIGYYGPYATDYVSPKGWKAPDYLTDRYYEMIKESGINLISYTAIDYANNPAAVLKALQLAEKHDICMYVMDSGIKPDMTVEEIEERMSAYSHFRSFKGIYICDEPSSPDFGDGGRMLDKYYEIAKKINSFENLVGYVNLFAYHTDWLGVNNNTYWRKRPYFEAYVDAYCEGCNAKMLSEDYYIFDAHTVETSRDYFENLEIMNQYAEKYNIPFWMFIQLGGQWNDGAKQQETERYYPRPEEVIWNVNTSLAAGAKGIAYFPLMQPYHFAYAPEGEMDFKRNGLITADGEKSAWFDCTKTANAQIHAVGSYLMEMTHKQMVTKGQYAELNLPNSMDSYRELVSVELKNSDNKYGTVIGCFEYDGSSAFYVVNNDINEQQDITLHFDGQHVMDLIDAEDTRSIQADSCTISLKPSAASLVILK